MPWAGSHDAGLGTLSGTGQRGRHAQLDARHYCWEGTHCPEELQRTLAARFGDKFPSQSSNGIFNETIILYLRPPDFLTWRRFGENTAGQESRSYDHLLRLDKGSSFSYATTV